MTNLTARMIRLAQITVGSYPEIVKLVNQDVNPIGAYSSVGATTVGLVADLEDATNPSITSKERHNASRDAGRKIALLITDIAVAIGYNAAVDAESFGTGAIATGNVIGLERTANRLAAKFANALGLHEFQQQMGLGDGTSYTNITDIPSDALMSLGGYDFVIAATYYRAQLEKAFEEHTGLNINDALLVGRLGLRLAESGLKIASGEIPDMRKVERHALSLAHKFGLDSVKGQDFQMIADVVHGSIQVANNIREGRFGAKDVSLIASMAQKVASRARFHGITPELAKDTEAIANVVASTTHLVDGFMTGSYEPDSITAIISSSKSAVSRLIKRGVMLAQNVNDISQAINELKASHHTPDGKLDLNKILNVSNKIVSKGIAQELVSKKSQIKIARAFKAAAKLPFKAIPSIKKNLLKRKQK